VRKKTKVTEVATRSQAHDENEGRSLNMAGLGSPTKQSSRGGGILSEYRGCTKSAKSSRIAVSRDWAANFTWYNASSVATHRTVGIRFKLYVLAILVFFDGE
jgi:hypothetical protein